MTDTGGGSVAKGQIDGVLAALAKAGSDSFGARREILERLSFDLLHHLHRQGNRVWDLT